jgi:chromatin remodeling complex protein RSC6
LSGCKQDAIKALIEARFDAISSADPPTQTEDTPPHTSPKRRANGHDDADGDGDEIRVSVQPPKKKQRKEKSEDMDDAKLAALLQAEENSRGRSTRGGGSKAAPKKKKPTPRKKSAKKVRPEDDSDVEGSEESGSKPRKAGGGFQKPFNLSYQLAELVGETQVITYPNSHVVFHLSNSRYSYRALR